MDNAISQQPVNIFGAILAQCTRLKPELTEKIRPLRKPDSHLITQNSLTIAELTDTLKEAMGLFKRYIILIDALNETPFQNTVLSTVASLTRSCPNLRVLITCTSDPVSNRDDFRFWIRQMVSDDVDQDIKRYVQYRISSESSFLALSTEIRTEIEQKIVSGANGMQVCSKLYWLL